MYMLSFFQDVWTNIEGFFEPVKDLLFKHHGNPVLWIGLFFLGVVIFWITYAALHREK